MTYFIALLWSHVQKNSTVVLKIIAVPQMRDKMLNFSQQLPCWNTQMHMSNPLSIPNQNVQVSLCISLLIYSQTVKMEFGPVQKNSSALKSSVISEIFWQICNKKVKNYFSWYRMRWNLIVWPPLMMIVSHMWCMECKKYRSLITNVSDPINWTVSHSFL